MAVVSGIRFPTPSPSPTLAVEATAREQPVRVEVPMVIGLAKAGAERALHAAGYKMVLRGRENPQPDDAVLRQMPPAGWADPTLATVRVSFLGANDNPQTLPAEAAQHAIELARLAIRQSTGEPGSVVQLESVTESAKDVSCTPTDCIVVRLNIASRGAAVGVDLSGDGRVVDISWQTTPFGLESLITDEELFEIAMSDPQLVVAAAGRPSRGFILSYGAIKDGGICRGPHDELVCITVGVNVEGGSQPALVAVNFLTGEARLDRGP